MVTLWESSDGLDAPVHNMSVLAKTQITDSEMQEAITTAMASILI